MTTQADIDRFGPGCIDAIGPMTRRYQDERIAEGHITLGTLIDTLATLDPAMAVSTEDGFGLTRPHSNRGFYVDLSFEPNYASARDGLPQTVGDLLALAQSALGAEYPGWKCGTFLMGTVTPLWIAPYGECGVPVTALSVHDDRLVIETSEVPF